MVEEPALLSTSPTDATGTSVPVRVVVIQSSAEGCEYQDDDSPANVEQHVRRANYLDHRCTIVQNIILTPTNYTAELVALARRFTDQRQFDCVVNLCDGAWDEPSCGIQVVDLLQNKLQLPFTGADVASFEPSRLQMKRAALAAGVDVPLWRFVYSNTDLENLLTEFAVAQASGDEAPLKFPLLVKHFSSYSSVGLTKESKVWDIQGLRAQCERMLETYGGALVEEFITGREFTVLACQVPCSNDPNGVQVMAYEPVECRFAPGEDFKHYNLKWVDYEEISWHPVTDADLAKRLKEMAVKSFQSMEGRGYGRIDVRSDETGQHLYFLEVNPNCGLFYPEGLYGSADFILDKTNPVTGHADFLLNQVEVARRIWKRETQDKAFEARYVKGSWGLYALRPIARGQLIQRNEEANIRVVSKDYVLKKWKGVPGRTEQVTAKVDNEDSSRGRSSTDALFNTWENFRAYCWPLSDNLFGMWQADPDEWQPLNHSCDPNAWYADGNGLDVVARRDIEPAEEICMDYATFVGYFPELKSFECQCKSPQCRGTITGMDIIKHPELALWYHGHMSDYVASKVRSEMDCKAEAPERSASESTISPSDSPSDATEPLRELS